MKLQRRTIAILITLIAIALIGLVALQYVLIANAIELKQQAFRQNVNAAMNAIVQRLETREALGNVFRVALKEPPLNSHMEMYSFHDDSMMSVSVTSSGVDSFKRVVVSSDLAKMNNRAFSRPPIRFEGRSMWFAVRTPQRVLIRAFNQATDKDTIVLNAFMSAGEHRVDVGGDAFGQGDFIFKFLSDSTTASVQVRNGNMRTVTPENASIGKREELVGRVVDRLNFAEQIPIEKRVNRTVLDSLIGRSLKEAGIDLPFASGVISERNDSLQIAQPPSYSRELQTSGFKARLFPNDIYFSFNQLALYFPDQQVFILKQIGPLLALTIVFMSIIVYCFSYTIRTIIRQKQFSVRLIDFINNMTHEFKTPISTVSVAVETMMHPNVVHDAEKITRYGAVIHDENLRMKNQVDKILQMAVLEEGTYNLNRIPVDIHEIITKAAENSSLQGAARGGVVSCTLEAEASMISADVVHLTNIINNILDNAVKYSLDRPGIAVKTVNVNGNVRITISDTGIGISAEDQQRVFEKYFRVHTGNVHDVKGFGLGLCYVKLMTEAHGGSITLKSELGKGTTIELTFPVIQPT